MFVKFGSLGPNPLCNKIVGFFGSEKNLGIAVAVTVATVGAVKLAVHIKKQNRRKQWNAVGKGVVVLHTIQRGKNTPSVSPFVLKLETYLKMANIKYEVDFTEPFDSNGQFPWVTLNGQTFTNSQLIMDRLGQEFNKDLSSHLTKEQRSVAQAMKVMMEHHFYWCVEYEFANFTDFQSLSACLNLSGIRKFFVYLLLPYMKQKLRKITHMVGMGRHSENEVVLLGQQDIAALSTWLGTKKFFMGDKPTEVDCAIFGFLAQYVWNFPRSPFGLFLKSDYKNLRQYCLRMKETVWPDWDKHLDPPVAAAAS